jgi:hypothetical protein
MGQQRLRGFQIFADGTRKDYVPPATPYANALGALMAYNNACALPNVVSGCVILEDCNEATQQPCVELKRKEWGNPDVT